MTRNATVALGAALTTMTPVGVALAAPTGPDTAPAGPDPLVLRTQVHGAGSIEARMRTTGKRLAAHRRLLARNLKLEKEAHGLSGRALREHGRRAGRWPNARLRRENHALARAASGGAGGALASIRACESGGDYATDTGNGFYGAYQFTRSTWAGVGGQGDPASASPAEQDRRAAILLARSGAGQWPVCGR